MTEKEVTKTTKAPVEEILPIQDSVKSTETVRLVSKLNYPSYISYDGQGMVISARGIVEGLDERKIGPLPKGIFKA